MHKVFPNADNEEWSMQNVLRTLIMSNDGLFHLRNTTVDDGMYKVFLGGEIDTLIVVHLETE